MSAPATESVQQPGAADAIAAAKSRSERALHHTSVFIDRASDWMNPILVKETRQALKSRQFVTTFMMLVLVAWGVSLGGLLFAGPAIEFGALGRWFFSAFFLVLSVAVLVAVPWSAYRSLLTERDYNTFELLSITTLSPRQIVNGKLANAFVQALLLYSAITPFIAFSSILQGFDLAQAIYLLVMGLLASIFVSMVALMFASFVHQTQQHGMAQVGLLIGLACGNILFYQQAALSFSRFDRVEFWWQTGFLLAGGVSYFVLFQKITTAQLTFESDNRSTAIRAICAFQFWALWGAWAGFCFYQRRVLAPQIPLFVSAVHWMAVGLFIATEDDHLSRRIVRGFPRNAFLRVLISPFMPGGSRGLLLATVHIAVIAASGWLMARYSPTPVPPEFPAMAAALGAYVFLGTALAAALARWGWAISTTMRPAYARVLTVVILICCLVVPLVPYAMEWVKGNSYSLTSLSNPFMTLEEIARPDGRTRDILEALGLISGVVLLMSLPAMIRGVYTIAAAPKLSRGDEQPLETVA